MAGRERLLDRGTRLGRAALARIGQELRDTRLDRGLSIDAVAAALGISNAEVSRVERALSPRVPAIVLFRFAAVVGLDLTARLYPGSTVLRDAAHVELLADFGRTLHPSINWSTEVPMPSPGDPRAWDALIRHGAWRYGIEAETSPRDAQALTRRIQLKARDGGVDGVLLVLRDTRRTREFLRLGQVDLRASFPVDGRHATRQLAGAVDPGGSAIVLVPRSTRRKVVTARV